VTIVEEAADNNSVDGVHIDEGGGGGGGTKKLFGENNRNGKGERSYK